MLWYYAGEVQLQSYSSADWRITSLDLSMFAASMKGYTNLAHFVTGKNEFREKCTNFLKAPACSPIPP